MTLRVRLLPAFFAAGLIAVSVSGCNIFDFAVDAEKTPLEQAEDAIRNGDYESAINALADSTGALKDSTDSMILYTYAKALLLNSGLSIAEIINLVEASDGASDAGGNALLEAIDGKSFEEQTAWYVANVKIADVLNLIRSGSATGLIDSSDISLDYSISNIMGGMLSLRDTNRDKIIDSNDFQINLADVSKLIGGDEGQGFSFDGVTTTDSLGNEVELSGLTAFLGSFTAGKRAKIAASGYTPDDINKFLQTFFGFLENGEDAILSLAEGKTSLSPEEIRKYIRQAAVYVNYYWYDDGLDNDGDGQADEEIIDGLDNDGDGWVDEDSGYMTGYDPTDNYYDGDKPNSNYWPLFNKWHNVTVE